MFIISFFLRLKGEKIMSAQKKTKPKMKDFFSMKIQKTSFFQQYEIK